MRSNPLLARLSGSRPQLRPRRRHQVVGPEVLEARMVLSTFTVQNALDAGAGSLRQAIVDASSAGGSNTIRFARNVRNITLSSGELAISGDLVIDGPGARRLTIGGNHASRVFDIQPGATVRIDGLTITDGLADGNAPAYPSCGGGILNQGTLTLDEVVVDGNRSVGNPTVVLAASAVFNTLGGALGGGIENFGTLRVEDSTISNNEALGASNADGSALPFPSFPGNALGGGIGSFGTLTVEDSTFKGNVARAGNGGKGPFGGIGGGGAIVNDADLTVTDSTFTDNAAYGGSDGVSPSHNGHALGGGIMSGTLMALIGARSATLDVSDCTFRRNLAQGGNDNRVTDAVVPPSEAPDNGYGGGILVYQGSAAISDITVTDNQAIGGKGYGINGRGSLGVGGGIFLYNFVGGVTATLVDSTIRDNDAIGGEGEAGVIGGSGLGGGVAAGGLGSPFTGPGSVTIRHSALTKNLAQGGRGGSGADAGNGLGGGLFSDNSSTVVLTCTAIKKNKAKGGQGHGGLGSGDDSYFGSI